MNINKKWSFTFEQTDSSKTQSFSLNRNLGFFLLSFAILSFILLFVYAFYGFKTKSNELSTKKIEQENKLLKEKLLSLNNELDSINSKLLLIEDWEDSIRTEKNFKEINKEIRKMGTGGLPKIDTTFIELDPPFVIEFSALTNKLEQLNKIVESKINSHENLISNINLQEKIYLNTPSIYPTFGRISDPYGWRKHPITKRKSFHKGLDIANKRGTPIYATADGTVKSIGRKKRLGRYILLNHEFGYKTKYGHLYKILVSKGERVKKGQIIGLMGNTGRSTGAHLHYEVIYYGKNRNPYRYLNKFEEDIRIARN